MTYSKGPWIYDAESGEIHTKDRAGFWGPDHEPVVVATVEQLDGVNNGPLLAAAPELLQALKGMLEIYGVTEQNLIGSSMTSHTEVECCDQARAAIAKATGESK